MDATASSVKQLAFNAAAPEYNDLPKRLSSSAAMLQWNQAMVSCKKLEKEVTAARGQAKEDKAKELEQAKTKLAELEQQLAELRASFEQDPLSLTSWMQALFTLADAGMTTFDVGELSYPYNGIHQLTAPGMASSAFAATEKLLGAFKQRYERERRDAAGIRIAVQLAPNIFNDSYSPELLEAEVDRMRANVYGAEAGSRSLDLVQLHWWDFRERDVMATLRALHKLTRPTASPDADGDAAAGGGAAEPPKVAAIGVIDFPAEVIYAALQAGIEIATLQTHYCVTDSSAQAAVSLCRKHGIQILARGGLLAGLMSPKYLGAACPDSADQDPDLDSATAALAAVAKLGGWERVQHVLSTVQQVADKHGVRMETVALRWQIDQGTTPVVTLRWTADPWKPCYLTQGHDTCGPAGNMNGGLFSSKSFLDEKDMLALAALAPKL